MCKAHDNKAHLLVIDSAAKQLAIGVWTSANSGRTSASTEHNACTHRVIEVKVRGGEGSATPLWLGPPLTGGVTRYAKAYPRLKFEVGYIA